MGYDQTEQCEILAEPHGDNHVHSELEEVILNIGLMYQLNSSLGFLASGGTTMYSPERGRMYIAYLGIRWML